MFDVCLEVDPEPERLSAVRALIRSTLQEWELAEHADSAAVVASELATNAILHARTPFRVTIQAGSRGAVRIDVADDNPRLPVLSPDDLGATSGRGLHVVAGLATRWGAETEGTGKIVWAELGTADPVDDPECVDLQGVQSAEEALERIDAHQDDPAAR